MMAKKGRMHRYVAFLRGINVGGHRVQMGHLRQLFEALDLSNVETFIASGNVIFDSPSADAAGLEGRIERHLAGALGYEVATFIRTPAELTAVAAHRPFAAEGAGAAGHTVSVGFLRRALDDGAVRDLLTFRTPVDDFEVVGREMYWLCRGKFTDSLVKWNLVAKKVPFQSTVRNVTTVRKLAAKYPPA